MANGGWDDWTVHLGTEMVVRLPSASEYAQAVEKEHRWLPALAPQLPLPIPVPLAKGKPSAEYPHSWSIYKWLDGVTATADRIASQVEFALDLADFLAALQSIEAAEGPQPGVHNWFPGSTLRTYDEETQRALGELAGHDEDSWAHGRGWALWKTLAICSYTYQDREHAEEYASAKRILHEIFDEYTVSRFATPTVTVPQAT